jgi:hypothetical protein
LYTSDDELCPNGKTALKTRTDFAKKVKNLERAGLKVHVIWECEAREQLKKDAEMRRFIEECRDTGPLDPKESYFGGRTGPLALKCDLEESGLVDDYELKVLDFTSLYPDRNYNEEYMVGHPTEQEFNDNGAPGTPVDWRTPADNPHKGIVKCFVVPPSNLHVPVIPRKYKTDNSEKLIFTLCDACAQNAKAKSKRRPKLAKDINPNVLCNHSDERRGFVATVSHLELNVALEKGYRVTRLYSVYEWKEWTFDLFRPYVVKFMKIKAEASGWPKEVGDNPEKQQKYIDDYERLYGITLNKDNIISNPGMKYFAKLYVLRVSVHLIGS